MGVKLLLTLLRGRTLFITVEFNSLFLSETFCADALHVQCVCRGVASIGLSGLEPPPLSSHRMGSSAGCWPS